MRLFAAWKQLHHACLLAMLVFAGATATAFAAQSSSPHYAVDETFFGSGGELNACSTNYCSKQTAGDTAVGNASSANYQTQAGSNVTDRQESIELNVAVTNINLGTLKTNQTNVATANFSVQSHLSNGYVVYTSSPGPQNGTYVMHTLTAPTASSTGTEQFGMNVVANSCPANTPSSGPGSCTSSLGANPVQIPDSTFAYGTPTARYNQANTYTYKNGDIIAQSNKSTSTTNYTISYLFNISEVTPGGTYTMKQSIVATATF